MVLGVAERYQIITNVLLKQHHYPQNTEHTKVSHTLEKLKQSMNSHKGVVKLNSLNYHMVIDKLANTAQK